MRDLRSYSVIFLLIIFVFMTGCWEDIEEPSQLKVISNRDYYKTFHHLSENAEESIEVVMYLSKFHGSYETQVNMILGDLVDANRRGLKVRVILERSNWDINLNQYNQEFMDSLSKYGITTTFDDSNVTTHAKCVVFDEKVALLGSTNWTTSALEYNNEMNVEIHNREICKEIETFINSLWEDK